MSTETAQDFAITVTDKARGHLADLKVNHENFMRLWLVNGGCKGLSYQAALDNDLDVDDLVIFEDDTIRIVSDPFSAQYFHGLTIDYSDDLVKSGFRFINPNAATSCGCGGSFTA